MYSAIVVSTEDITRMAVSGYIQRTMHEFKIEAIFPDIPQAERFLNNNPVNIVVLDVAEVAQEALALCEHISQSCPGTRVLMISGYEELSQARKAVRFFSTVSQESPAWLISRARRSKRASSNLG